MRRHPVLSTLLVVATVLAPACGDDEGRSADAPATSSPATADDAAAGVAAGTAGVEIARAALAEQRAVIDVRTPDEYDEGHVAGAQMIDLQDPSFEERVTELPADGKYVVYCRSGNRSAQAAQRMRAAGLDVVDGGGLGDMTEAGWTLGD